VHYRSGDYAAFDVQVDTDTVIPFYAWLAKQHTFCDHHFGVGSNSTPGHMMLVGGQCPTLKNPPFGPGGPVWDLPSIFLHAARERVSWAAFPGKDDYPIKFYKELQTATAKKHLHPPGDFVKMAAAGTLPQLVYAWSADGSDEHPPLKKGNTAYISRGHNLVWERVDAIVKAGQWDNTVFILTWDDWGGYADHVATPSSELVPDALHPDGFPAIGGSRIPLVMFGGGVHQGIDNRWHSHASVLKTIIDLLHLSPLGVPRVDSAPSLADRVSPSLRRPSPPAFGSIIVQPPAPNPAPVPAPPPPWTGPIGEAMPPLVANHGKTVPPPTDGHVQRTPPVPPPTTS
jgi:hypothetical protein